MFHNRKITKRLLMERAGLVSEEKFYSDKHRVHSITQTISSFMDDSDHKYLQSVPVDVLVEVYKKLGLFDLAGTVELENKLSEMMKSNFEELHQELSDAHTARAMDADPMYIDEAEEPKLKSEEAYLEYFLAGFFNLDGKDKTRKPDHKSEEEILNMEDEYGFPSKSDKAIAFATAFNHDWDKMTAEEAEQAGLDAWKTDSKTFMQVVNKLEDEMGEAASDYRSMDATYRDLRTSR